MRKLRFVIMILAASFIAQSIMSTELLAQKQTPPSKSVMIANSSEINNINEEFISLTDLLSRLEQHFDVTFLFNDEVVKNKLVKPDDIQIDEKTGEKLAKILDTLGLSFNRIDEQTYVLFRKIIPVKTNSLQEQISGTVTAAGSGETLPGVNIVVKGTTIGTSTDDDGDYNLTVPSLQDTLVFSFIGFQSREVPIAGRSVVNIEMTPVTISGSELVVVGYSTQKKEDLTGSVSVVDLESMNSQPNAQVANQLQGQASGVSVISSGQPGEEPMVHIRGLNTFGNNTPLYVVDGVPTQNISDLNTNNIASVQVMKDAGAASIYGSRAANGVIIVTTKKGGGDTKVTYDSYYGYQIPKRGNPWDILSPQEMAELEWMAIENSGGDPSPHPQYGNGSDPVLPDYITPAGASEGDSSVDPDLYHVVPNYTDPSQVNNFYQIIRANKSGTNWYQEIFNRAPIANNNLTVSGGGEDGSYLVSFNYMSQQGTLMETYLKRYTIRANTQFNISDNIRIGENLAYSVRDNPQLNTSLNTENTIGMSYRIQPIIPVYDIMGNFAGSNGDAPGAQKNPVGMQHRTRDNKTQGNRLFGNVFAEVDALENLTLRTSLGGVLFTENVESITYPEYENTLNVSNNAFSKNSSYRHEWTWTNTLTYQTLFKDVHNLSIVLGTEAYQQEVSTVGGTSQDFFTLDPDYMSLSTGSGTRSNFSSVSSNGLFSLIGRLDYNFDDKYLLSGTLRRDGSSKFTNNRYGWFPSVSAGWRISQESFMNNIEWITDLKIRGGYGIMGNQFNVSTDNAYSLYAGSETSSYYDIRGTSSEIAQGFMLQRIGNADAKWEKNVNSNIGIDAILFDAKLEVNVDYYRKDIRDLLYNPELIGAAGNASAPFVNVANITNNGIDMSLTGRGNLLKEINYNAKLTFTTYQNEILKITEGQENFDLSPGFFGSAIIRNAVGQPLSSYYGYQIEGFWDDQSEIDNAIAESPNGIYQEDIGVGRFRYQDTNNDGQITPEDRVFLGNPHPDYTYGFNLGLNYKNFDLDLFFYGVQGNEIWNSVKWFTDFSNSFFGARSHTALYDSWRPDNKDASVSIQETSGGAFSSNGVPNSYYVEDGSYLRLKNLVVGYSLPVDLIQKISLEKLRVYVQAANLFTITGYSGIDPEIGGASPTSFGIDRGAYASTKQFLFGVNLSF